MVTKGYGITLNDIDNGCPADFKDYDLAHNEEIREQDLLNYYMGLYNLSALSVAVNFTKEKRKYPKEPFLAKVEKNVTAAEGREVIAQIEMQQRINILNNLGLPQSPK